LNVEVLQPLAAIFKWHGMLTWLGTKNGLFVVCLVTVALAGYLVSLGMEGYAKVQKYCFYLGMIGLGVVLLVMLFGSHSGFISAFNQESSKLFGVKNAYGAELKAAGTAFPKLGFSPFLGASLLLVPFLCFWILWPNWGATLYGEVRGAGDYKKVMTGMMSGLWVTLVIGIVFIVLSAKLFGWSFFQASNVNYINFYFGFTTSAPIPVWPYPPLLVGMYTHNALFSALLILVFGAWFIGWAGTLFLSSTRVVFAAAFDRILPERVADVSARRHVPYWALVLMLVPAVGVSAVYAYSLTFRTYIFAATLVIAVTFFGTSIAATILPWRKKALYQNSAIAKYKVGGIPLITISGGITTLFLGWNLYKWLWPPLSKGNVYGLNGVKPMIFMGSFYALALVIYVVAKIYRKSQGIDLGAIYKEIPVD
jgi:amino acid transporter